MKTYKNKITTDLKRKLDFFKESNKNEKILNDLEKYLKVNKSKLTISNYNLNLEGLSNYPFNRLVANNKVELIRYLISFLFL